ncbi:MAG: DnaJ domain-containing protein [Gemmatimonadota bacterium]
MSKQEFVDFYEVLQVSQNADTETIERVFRLLARRYHPDNQESGNEEKFRLVHTAYQTLRDPGERARFDVHYDRQTTNQWQIFGQGTAHGSQEDDQRIIRGILSVLYVARRRDPHRGGFGNLQLERVLGVPREHLEFPLWILKQRGWIEILDNGQTAITIHGIDQVIGEGLEPADDRLLPRAAATEAEVEMGRPDPGEAS